MIIDCPDCNKKFDIDQNLIPTKGRLLQCGSCNYKWFFELKISNEKFDDEIKSLKNKLPEDTEIIIDEAEATLAEKTGTVSTTIWSYKALVNSKHFFVTPLTTFGIVFVVKDLLPGSSRSGE